MPRALERLECLLADAPEIGAADVHQRRAVETVELQVDFEPCLARRQRIDEVRVLGDAQPVGVDHQVPDRPVLRHVDDGKDVGMDRRLAARQLQQVRLAFAFNERVHHCGDGFERQMRRLRRRGAGETHGTFEIAGLVNLDDRQAGMLLVIRAQPAIERAAVIGAGLQGVRPVAGLQKILLPLEERNVGRDQHLFRRHGSGSA